MHAERLFIQLDSQLWPERVLRDEALETLQLSDLAPLLNAIPPLDHVAALENAAAWLQSRDPDERVPRLLPPLSALELPDVDEDASPVLDG